ncbi:CU044_5270 family protein [Streptomyces sp. NPDC051940]|uniref:CU044_5270 family protein n=1 Tax=Streptomyces sp. NPDC051940 TaxID=3155675 RepID=UPI00343C9ACB
MDEMTLVRELRADAPTPGPARLALGRDRLLAETGEARPARRRVNRRALVVAAAALAVTGSLLGPKLLPDDDTVSRAAPASAPPQAVEGTAKEVLERIAAELEQAPPQLTVPRAEEWLYSRVYEENMTSDEQPAAWRESWHLFGDPALEDPGNPDDARSERERFEFIAALPADPQALIDKAVAYFERSAEETREDAAFRSLDLMIHTYPAQPDGLAKIYRAMATLPGIRVEPRTVPDAVGRQAIAISRTVPGGMVSRDEVLIDPVTYTYLGSRLVALVDDADPDLPARKGDVIINLAVVQQGLVDGEGERP